LFLFLFVRKEIAVIAFVSIRFVNGFVQFIPINVQYISPKVNSVN